jgi:transposase
MFNNNVIAIDLAKSSFHVCTLNKHNEITTDRSFTRKKMTEWLVKQPKSTIAIEACGSAHHWARFVMKHGHTPVLLPPKLVTPFRKGHKTDKNDALAIAIAAKQPQIKTTAIKTIEQQGLQSIERIRQHHSDSITAIGNMLRGLVYEFGLTIPKGSAALKREIPVILEDAENDLPDAFRHQFSDMYQFYLTTEKALAEVENALALLIKQNTVCQELMNIEGIGPVNALGLSLVLGEQGKSFKNGREASACIGVTPKQYSTGGVVTLGGIGKKRGNKRLRSTLIQGALSVAKVVNHREPKNTKEAWLKALIDRCGINKAAVALANKNIRTAWAMLRYDNVYKTPKALAACSTNEQK